MEKMDLEFEEFCEIINEPIPADPEKKKDFDAFLFWCFMEIFRKDPEDGATVFLAAAAAHSFSQSNYVEGNRIANKSIRIRHPSKSLKTKPRKGLAMRTIRM